MNIQTGIVNFDQARRENCRIIDAHVLAQDECLLCGRQSAISTVRSWPKAADQE
jgi:hypothetical protein